jgi:type II secretory pathway pseudopilin PulG
MHHPCACLLGWVPPAARMPWPRASVRATMVTSMTSIVIALIGAAASVVAAIVAARYARSTQRNDAEAQRARELESRISERKYEVYKPMIDLFGDVLNSSKSATMAERSAEIQTQLAEFSTWVNIYGSDGAVIAFHNFQQAAFHLPVPPLVTTRLFADFLLEARRDIGRSDTSVTRAQIMGMRISDLYEAENYRSALDLPFEELCRREGWNVPWLAAPGGKMEPPKPLESSKPTVNKAEN